MHRSPVVDDAAPGLPCLWEPLSGPLTPSGSRPRAHNTKAAAESISPSHTVAIG